MTEDRMTLVGTFAGAALAVGIAMACSETPTATKSAATADAIANSSPFVVAATSRQTGYVSLPPQAIPTGVTATIRNRRIGSSAVANVVDGGFDPVALKAVAGDTIVATVQTTDAPIAFSFILPARKPPVIVRTEPPPNKRDVALDVTVIVVFSEPIDSSTLTPSVIQLATGGQGGPLVAGQLSFADTAHLSVQFVPAAPLASRTDYALLVTQDLRDVDGDALAAAVNVPFTTEEVGTSGAVGVTFAAVTAGGSHSCGLATDGTAYCWGANDHAQLGDGTTIQRTTPVLVAGGLTFTMVGAGASHTCGATFFDASSNGSGYCWGSNTYGQLGDGSTTQRSNPTLVGPGANIDFISAGGDHSCSFAYGDGFVSCWGSNNHGQLGNGSTTATLAVVATTPTPCIPGVPVPGTSDYPPPGASCPFSFVRTGGSQTCAEAGGADIRTYEWYCWGANANGQLGDGSTTDRTGPTLVDVGRVFAYGALSVGDQHACGVAFDSHDPNAPYDQLVSGDAYCWGLNSSGQLGDGSTTPRTSPVRVAGGLTFFALSAGGSHSCGLAGPATGSGTAFCWGDNTFGQLGNGTFAGSATPVAVAGGFTFTSITTGARHTCGVTTARVIWCWGDNSNGQLGDGTTTNRSAPVKVAGQP